MVGPQNWTPAEGSNKLAESMKKEESWLVAVEDFYWACLWATKLQLGLLFSKRGSRIRRSRITVGRKQTTLWDRHRPR